jgi:hypothetical protein
MPARASVSGTTKTVTLAAHQLLDICWSYDSAGASVCSLSRIEGVSRGDLLVSVAGRELLEATEAEIKDVLLGAMTQQTIRVVLMEKAPAFHDDEEDACG